MASLYHVGVETVAPASVASVAIADKANLIIANHDEKYLGISIADSGEVRVVAADTENDPILNDFYGAEVDRSDVRFAAIYGPPPKREELQVYKRAQSLGTVTLYSRNPLVIGIGSGLAGLVIGLMLKGRR